ncbi:sarcosine oxidase subunit gamma [Thalassobacter stenotrophicus]|uniref:sarcosine oxidase subunit gamma n=1 Tax=Thalassobacter stenotrophicus TaxID=266809 RepID=UPI0022A90ECE|nr:sarcosine oxidase subunit gamma family protein [Thalassobacter stenotrophicus]UYP69070.1 sarcosine oxidase subunit gamma [Thalassobacter stenotrophicus]
MSNAMSVLEGVVSTGFVTVQDAGLTGMVSVRADLTDAATVAALASCGITVPAVRQIVDGVAWMAPDEVLLVTEYANAPALAQKVQAAMADTHALVHVVSDARAVLRVEGAGTKEALAKLCPVDLATLAPGEVRRTRLAQVAAAFWLEDAENAQIICFRSVADYVFGALQMSARKGSEVGVFTR